MTNLQISISRGNIKMGAIPSVSLPACITCNPDAPCFKQCYAVRMERLHNSVKDAYINNLQVLQSEPAVYWLQVKTAATVTRFFRYHVSGDIPNYEYLLNMIKTAEEIPGTRFLAFTKQYNFVNEFINQGGTIPNNLKIILSNWGAWKCYNPHGLPVCEVIFKDTVPSDNWKICGGNCTDCACRSVGCWELKNGETIAIYKH